MTTMLDRSTTVEAPAPAVPGPSRPLVQLREDLGLDLAGLIERLSTERSDVHTEDVPVQQIEVALADADPHFVLAGRQVPASRTGTLAFGALLGVPSAFLNRFADQVGTGGSQFILESLLRVYGKSAVTVTYGEGGVVGVVEAGRKTFDPVRIVEVAQRVLGTGAARVVRLVDDPQEFAFDVVVPADYDRGVGGDPRVGDITVGGIRFGYGRKRNLAPWVQPYTHRLLCTNGQSVEDPGLRVDARGAGIDDVLAELEAAARRAFGRTSDLIRHFYDLRSVRVDNPERTIAAVSRERGIPDRSLVRLIDLARSEALPDAPSMFDVVNLITNLANDPAIRNDGGRLILENAGGAVVAAHEARCSHCKQKVAD
jgi:hypothetical protein